MLKKSFTVLSITMFSAMIGIGIISPIMPIFAEKFGASGIMLGLIFSGYTISRTIMTPIFTRASDRYNRTYFIYTGLLAYSIFSLLYIPANSILSVFLVRLAHGVASAMVTPISIAFIADLAPKNKEGEYMGTFNIPLFAGFGIGPFIGGVLTDFGGLSSSFFGMFGLSMFALTLSLLYLRKDKPKSIDGPNQRNFISLLTILRNKVMKALFIYRTVRAFGTAGILAFLPILGESMNISIFSTGLILSANLILGALLQRFGGKLADRYNKRMMMVVGSLLISLALFLMPNSGSFTGLLLLNMIMGIGSAISMPAATAVVVEQGRTFGMGSTIGLFSTAMGLGMVLSPTASGIIMDLINISFVFYISGIVSIIGIIVFIYLSHNMNLS